MPQFKPGDVVVMDNLSSQKRSRTRKLIESAGAGLAYLPPCSPDLNPIEMVFAKIKQSLCSLACRTGEALWNAMQSALENATASDAANCFRHCRYSLQTKLGMLWKDGAITRGQVTRLEFGRNRSFRTSILAAQPGDVRCTNLSGHSQ